MFRYRIPASLSISKRDYVAVAIKTKFSLVIEADVDSCATARASRLKYNEIEMYPPRFSVKPRRVNAYIAFYMPLY